MSAQRCGDHKQIEFIVLAVCDTTLKIDQNTVCLRH